MEMEAVKVQITKDNIQYKKDLGLSFAQILNTLMQMSKQDPAIEQELVSRITNSFGK
jgi:hypothetical protein